MPTDVGFLNQNLIRAFPFINNPNDEVPDWLVVDFRAIVMDGIYDPRVHTIELAWVSRYEDRLRFGFRTDAPDLADQELVFERDLNSTDRYQTEFVASTPLLETVEERCGCSPELLCNPDFTSDESCGPELLCNPNHNAACSAELLCNPGFDVGPTTSL